MAKLKLPFELEKPSNDTYVTQASEIGYEKGSIADVLAIEKLQSLTPSTTGALGYVPKTGNTVGNAISFGSFGSHNIYTIEEGKKYQIEIEYPSGNAYAYAITDANDIILQVIDSGIIFGEETSGTKTYTFGISPNQAKLYVSVMKGRICNCYEVHSQDISDVINDLSEEVEDLDEAYDILDNKIDEQTESLQGQIEDLQEDLNVTAKTLLQPSTSEAEGYIPYSRNSVGNAISFGSFLKHDIYTIEANKKYEIEIEFPGGNDYAYAITDANDVILQIVNAITIFGEETSGIKTYTFNISPNQAKLYISALSSKVHNCRRIDSVPIIDVVEELSETVIPMSQNAVAFFGAKDFCCDGDSMTSQAGWPSRINSKLHFKTTNNNSCGNATCCDRTSNTSGTTYYPQWAPDCTEQKPFVDYKGLADPNYAEGGEGVYTSGTPEFDQATANNCIYGHLGRLIKMVNDGVYPTPQIFIMNLMGVNDTWGTGSIDATIGTFEEAISGSYDQIQRDTILNSVRWFVTKFRITFPQCKLFWKTSTQQSAEMHANFYKIEEPLLQLLRYLSVPVIDSYAEVGIMRELEHYDNNKRSQNQWTSDGTHPTSAGYQMDGDFVASKLKSWFSAFFY